MVELLRFCLGASAYTEEVDRSARAQALAILESGTVTVVVDVDGHELEIRRSASDSSPQIARGNGVFEPPIVLSQSELERLALDASGRLRLIDDFRSGRTEREAKVVATQQLISSLTVEIQDLSREVSEFKERMLPLEAVSDELRQAEDEQQTALQSLDELDPEKLELADLGTKSSVQAVRLQTISDSSAAVQKWSASLSRVQKAHPRIPAWPEGAGESDGLAEVRKVLAQAANALEEAGKQVQRALEQIQSVLLAEEATLTSIEDQARPLRRRLDEAIRGAGDLSKAVSQLKQQAAQRESLRVRLGVLHDQLDSLLQERRHSLEELELARLKTFEDRQAIVLALNSALSPLVHVEVERAAFHEAYAEILSTALQGSGLHYKTLAPRIAERMSPRELAEAVDRSDIRTLSSLAEIPDDRAVRVIAQLSQQALSELLISWVDDGVNISLLDGSKPKQTLELSTGQRCTAILPIIMQHRDRVLIMDQPEDNLDNAFVVDTLVKSISDRQPQSQYIVSTHNANIPVLGEADRVVLMESSGRRGFAAISGSLHEKSIVDAITTVMEGGRRAFERRAEFYDKSFDGR